MEVTYRDVPVLVLGGSGFIGRWTVRALHARGAEVTVAVRDPAQAAALAPVLPPVRLVAADLVQPSGVEALVEAAAPAVVFNLAGYGIDRAERRTDVMYALNTAVVARLCAALPAVDAGRWNGVRLVHTGSALEYGRVQGLLSETREPQPTTEYGRTKLEGTRAVQAGSRASGLRTVVARLFTVYGPGEHAGRLLPALMCAARTGTRLALTSGRQRRSFTYVEDVADGLLRLAVTAAAPGIVVNLAGNCLHSVREFVETAATVLDVDPARLDFGALPDRDDEMWHGDVDVTRLHALTSWLPSTSIADGIRRTWEISGAA